MPLRVVGVLSVLIGVSLIGWAYSGMDFHGQVEAQLMREGITRLSPVSPEVLSLRSTVLAVVLACSGLLCIGGGALLMARRRWGISALAIAAVIPIAFPIASRLVAPSDFHFQGPAIPDMLVFSVIGVIAALAFAFRTHSKTSPNKSPERTCER